MNKNHIMKATSFALALGTALISVGCSTKPNENTVMKPETAEITSAPSVSMQPDAGKENATDTVDQTDVPTQQTEDDKKRESSEAMILTVRNGSYAIASDFSGFDIEARYTEKVDESKL